MADAVEAFWQRAITTARLNPIEVVTGPNKDSGLMPPAWSLDDASVSDALTTGTLTLTSPAGEHEMLPEAGGLSILLWEDGSPAALLRTSAVDIRPAAEIDDVGDWQDVRQRVRDSDDVVVERFEIIADNA